MGQIGLIGIIKKHIWSLLIGGFVLFSLLPTLYELGRAGDIAPIRQFELVHNFPTDYNFYLSRIRQGLEGSWTAHEVYTSELHSGSLIHQMYILMGQVGRWLRVPTWRAGDIYHVARVVLAVALLTVIAEFCKRIWGGKGSWGVVGFLLAVTASSWPKLVYVEGIARSGGYMSWWSVVDSLQRITFIPHLLAGQILIIVLIGSLTEFRVLRLGKNIIFLGLLGFLLGMIFPPGLIFVYAVIGIHMLLQGREMKKWVVPYIGFVCISAPAIVYLLLVTSIYPWKRLAEFDILHPLPFDYLEYAKALGPMGVLGAIGLMVALYKRDERMHAAVSWVVAWVALLVIFKFIPAQSPLRFSEMLPNVPLGVLTAFLFYRIGRLRDLGYLRDLPKVIPILLVVLGLFHMYSSWLWQKDFIDHKIRAGLPLVPTGSYVMYPLKDFVGALIFIQDAVPRNEVVLGATTAGNYIPVHTGHTVYIGHDNTVRAEQKKILARDFFSGRMSVQDARMWLIRERIGAVFFGPQEREEGGIAELGQPYPFLEKVYVNTLFRVYRVR